MGRDGTIFNIIARKTLLVILCCYLQFNNKYKSSLFNTKLVLEKKLYVSPIPMERILLYG